jgi:hypothetical protein
MFQRSDLQARNPIRTRLGRMLFLRSENAVGFLGAAVYPTVPAGWPNRLVRRAVKQGREFRLPACWRQALVTMPNLRTAIKTL